jgi:flavin reductase (DIM6/NTAB) family NADH-FMN oxidoreductase RutF
MADPDPSPLARALGRMPSGLYVVTTGNPQAPLGFVGSLVQQVGFDPPTVCVAIAKGRDHLEAVRERGGFTLSVIDADSSGLMGAFFRKYEDGASPYDGLETQAAPSGLPVLKGALAWLDCRLSGEHATGDHVLVFGVAEAGELLREGEPSVHLRSDGLSY